MPAIPIRAYRRRPNQNSSDVAGGLKTFPALGPLRLPTRCSWRLVSRFCGCIAEPSVIQGGSQLSSASGQRNSMTPLTESPSDAVSSSLPEGLQAVRRNLSVADAARHDPSGPSAMLALPQYYWNVLSAGNTAPVPNGIFTEQSPWQGSNDFGMSQIDPTLSGDDWQGSGYPPQPNSAALDQSSQMMDTIFSDNTNDVVDWGLFDLPAGSSTPGSHVHDPAAISSALMAFMANAAKGR